MKLLLLSLLLFNGWTNVFADDCSSCESGEGSCVNNGTNEVCKKLTDCVGQCFQIFNEEDYAYAYKNENASITVEISSPSDFADVTATISGGGSSGDEAADEESSNANTLFTYTITNVTKSDEEKYRFLVSGSYNNGSNVTEVCAVKDVQLYVFSVSILLDKDLHVVRSGKDSFITVTIDTEIMDWSRIQLYESSPLRSDSIKLSPSDWESFSYRYKYPIHEPYKPGVYEFLVREISPYNISIYTEKKTSAEVYVLSTKIEAKEEFHTVEIGQSVSLNFTVSTEILANQTQIRILHPNGSSENQSLSDPTSFVYDLLLTENQQFGTYNVSAWELVNDSFYYLSSWDTVVISSGVNVTSSLNTSDGVYYTTTTGTNGTIVCQYLGQIASWLSEDGISVDKSFASGVHQLIDDDGVATLYVTDKAHYRSNEGFTCSADYGDNKTIFLSVQGLSPPDITPISNGFECQSKGNPVPDIAWFLCDGDETSCQSPPEAFFSIDSTMTSTDSFEANSTITFAMTPYCLGNSTVLCTSTNGNSSTNDSKSLNQGDVSVYLNEYIVVKNDPGDYTHALSSCFGRLVRMEGEAKIQFVHDAAKSSGISEFYTGAKRYNATTWIYPDGTIANIAFDDTGPSKDCSKALLRGFNWTYETCDCTDNINIICEAIDESAPANLTLEPGKCDSSILNAVWDLPDGVTSQTLFIDGNEILTLTNETRKTLQNLVEATEYTVRIETKQPYCVLFPYAETTGSTSGPPNPPTETKMNLVGDSTCSLKWHYTGDDIGNFSFNLTTAVAVDENDEFSPTTVVETLSNATREINVTLDVNQKLNASISSRSCVGCSQVLFFSGNCITEVGPPASVESPDFYLPSEFNGKIPTVVPKADNTPGPVSCQFLVVHLGKLSTSKQQEMTDERFQAIKSASDVVNTGDEYFAYAIAGPKENTSTTLGDDDKTKCSPDESSSVQAWDRVFPFDVPFHYFLVVTIPGDGILYKSMSDLSQEYELHTRDSSNAGLIVLCILSAIAGLALLIFLLRRCRSKKGRPRGSFLRFSYSANSEHVYDTL